MKVPLVDLCKIHNKHSSSRERTRSRFSSSSSSSSLDLPNNNKLLQCIRRHKYKHVLNTSSSNSKDRHHRISHTKWQDRQQHSSPLLEPRLLMYSCKGALGQVLGQGVLFCPEVVVKCMAMLLARI